MSVKYQLVLAFGLLCALVLVISLASMHALSASNANFKNYVEGEALRQGLALDVRGFANKRAIAVRNMVLVKDETERDLEKAIAVKAHEDLQRSLDALRRAMAMATDVSDADRNMVGEISKVEAAYSPVALEIVRLASSNLREEATRKMNVECRPLLSALITASRNYIEHSKAVSKTQAEAAEQAYGRQRNWLIALSGLSVLLACVLGWVITRRLVRALGAEPADLSNAAKRIAAGDLNPVHGADAAVVGSVFASMGAMQAQLVQLIGQVRTSADSIATASAQISQGNNELSQRTEAQAASLEQTAASMEELGSTVRQNADSARQANEFAQGASAVAVKGGDVVGQVVATMKGINDSSKKIADIIGVIDSIAFQTNILALNAAVEAARAGEQGRGFAVVASEVRSLAGRSSEASKEIRNLIATSVARVDQGTVLVDQAGATMTEIVGSIRRVTDIMAEISTASAEQSAGVAQVGEAVGQMDRATQQNAALVEESAAAAQSMKSQALELVRSVSAFKTSGALVTVP